MSEANCRLCRDRKAIRNSHVLSKLGYRRYVSDQSRGGASIKLHTLEDDSRQLTREWFCEECEKLFGENYAAQFLDGLKQSRINCPYDGELLRFAVACSWRTCLFTLEDESNFANRRHLVPACKTWKAYLRGESQSIEPYTQHAFVVQDASVWEERLGMLVAYMHGLVFTQIGPLMCFGLLTPPHLDDQWSLNKSRVDERGGNLSNLVSGEVNYALTDRMRNTIDYADIHCNVRVREFSKSRNRTPAHWSERKGRRSK